MTVSRRINFRFWFPALLIGSVFAVFALAPQLALWYDRGQEWNGSFAMANEDEPAYAAYVQSLIDGKPLRNSPYTGATSETNPDFRQSLFSIQFLASIPTALFAKAVGLRAATAMIFLSGITAFLSALSVFWLLFLFSDHPVFAFAAASSVLVLGSISLDATGIVGSVLAGVDSIDMQSTFMRRSVPAISFPVFILLHCFVWRVLTDEKRRWQRLVPVVFSFCFLIYSYLYHWTAAAAWLLVLGITVIALKREVFASRKREIFLLGSVLTAAAIPYLFLVSDRDKNIDTIQHFFNTRVPDLFRASEFIALFSILLMLVAQKKGWLRKDGFYFVFLLSMSLMPFIVFNQQVISGITFQPFHYGSFAMNFTILIAVLSIVFFCGKGYLARPHANKLVILIAISVLYLGFMGTTSQVESARSVNVLRDEFAGAAKAIRDADKNEGDRPGNDRMVVSFELHNFSAPNNDEFPISVSRNVLWATHQISFSDLAISESKKRFFVLLHLSNYDERWVRENVEKNAMLRVALFGWGRNESHLAGKFLPLTKSELDQTCAEYLDFRSSFDFEMARENELEYLITYNLAPNDFSQIDRWYSRGPATTFDSYSLYRLQLKEKENVE